MKTKEIAYCGMMVAIIAVLGLIPPIAVPIIPVPISFQTMGIMLSGCLLGKKLGTISVVIFLLLVAVGMPILAGFRGGMAVFAGPTVGFLVSWPFCTYLIGSLVQLNHTKHQLMGYIIANLIGGMLLMNLMGGIGLTLVTHISLGKALWSCLIFFPGDIVKAVIVAIVAWRVKQHHFIKL
ncbi:biotin transporter BioY [Fructilactobacillus lindneri]|uniref:Biotin transporter n=1 Tax=Fructilactobacillus lindneri TaxID=53444 RepID=A0AB33BQL7_9LACO|nr:biotin transporter BioY [Fructilactobacillus lindneri]ANZ57614.1 biotin biosynthesis protein BioY [Fructilactobacillus lindneri]ANZ58884.1 biotin biosynthesis protein BioY [Fructilactobacillus lindneri]POG97765.1 biotin biosynthesis protein BioY [Fructilactobacillus lindneri]POH00009.1 biotin biosynthesis protein BioY [Fructilactobacillus lindneri]POH02436.1 biotin biosynthesis protein BioY [Fructilactobacillus lindneri]